MNTKFPAHTNGQDLGNDPFYSDVPIDALGLSTRAYNALARSGLRTVGQVAQFHFDEILQLRNIGEETAREIDSKLHRFLRSAASTHRSSSTPQRVASRFEPIEGKSLDEWQRKYAILADDITSIARLGLSRRVYNALYRAGYTSIGHVASTSVDDLRWARNIGSTSIAEIEERLNARLAEAAVYQKHYPVTHTGLHESRLQGADSAPNLRANGSDLRKTSKALVPEILPKTMFLKWSASCLSERELEVITLRYGLEQAERLTLAKIGQLKGLSRERIRQIEKKALLRLTNGRSSITPLTSRMAGFIVQQGGVVTIAEAAIWFTQKQEIGVEASAAGAVELLCAADKRFVYLRRHRLIILATLPERMIDEVWTSLADLLSTYMVPTPTQLLVARYCDISSYQVLAEGWPTEAGVTLDSFVDACVRTHPDFEEREPGMVALGQWDNRIVDNIIIALRELGEPTHFTAISESVNKQLPDDRQITAHNVQGHMLRYDDVFVRVGHGIYGLVEWGKKQDDSVVETAVRFLRETNQPQHINTITEYVLKSWQINPATVYMALHDEGYYRDSTKGDLCMLLGEGVFTLSEWEEARKTETEPMLSYCPPILPDPPDFANALFESAIVAHKRLRAAPHADMFLDGMFQWAQASANQKRWLRQGVLNAYYLLGLIPYTYIFGGDNPHLRSTLPAGEIGAVRQTCLSTLTRRLAFMPDFWGLLQTMQPVRQKELSEAFVSIRGDGLDDTGARLTLLAGLGAVVRGVERHFRLTKLGEQTARNWGVAPYAVDELTRNVEPSHIERIDNATKLASCPPLLPDRAGENGTFLDSIVQADRILASTPTTEQFLFEILEKIGRPGPKSTTYYQAILDGFFIVGLIDRTNYLRNQAETLESRFPKTYDISGLRHHCIQFAKTRLQFADQFLIAAYNIQPFSREEIQSTLGMTIDNAARHIRLFVNLGVMAKGVHGYKLTSLGIKYLPTQVIAYVPQTAESVTLHETIDSDYSEFDDGLAAFGFLLD